MTYATIMVSLASDQSNDRGLAIAREMADRFEARVIGIAAAAFSPPLYFTAGEQADRMLDEGRNAIKQRLSGLEAEFRKIMAGGPEEIEWRVGLEAPVGFMAREARAADVIVIGQGPGGAFTDPFSRVSPGDLVMLAARPLLVVPDEAGWLDLRRVLVAWKDRPETRRAVVDSLPLLRKAGEVTIAEIVEAGGSREEALSRTGDVVAWLSHHGIAANALVPDAGPEPDVAIVLDRIASDLGTGVVVAGAYGHSRFREWVFGGVTQHLATGAKCCALLSR